MSQKEVVKRSIRVLTLDQLNMINDHQIQKLFLRQSVCGPCEDFTVDKCDLPERDIIDSFVAEDVTSCQSICIIFADCDTFQFNKTNDNNGMCTLLTTDYRQSCEFNAGPKVRNNLDFIFK